MDLDAYFVRFLLLDETQITGLIFACMAIGGVLAFLAIDVQTSIRRSTYFLAVSGLYLAMVLGSFVWPFIPAAAEANMIWVLVTGFFTYCTALGAACITVAGARSRDIQGDRGKAYLALIPIANLYLHFKGPKLDSIPAPRPPRRLARLAYSLPITAIGVVVLAISGMLEKVAENTSAYDPSHSPVLMERISTARSAEDFFRFEANSYLGALPMRIDSETILTDVVARDELLTYTYEVADPDITFNASFKPFLATEFCSDGFYRDAFAKGGELHLKYLAADQTPLGWFRIADPDCPK